MPGRKPIKIITNTVHSKAGSGKLLCPMCAWWAIEALMVHDIKSNLYVCSECGYKTPPNLDPIHDSKIAAGNEQSFERPYSKAVKLTRNRNNTSEKINGSFEQAWNS